MLSFSSPWLLAGILLIGIPIVLHLVMRQQPKRLEFPALRFVRRRRDANRRKLRLKHLLLLAMRCLLIALLALAVSRPLVRSAGFLAGGEAPAAAALVFDTTPRMEYRHENQTRLEKAQEIGRWAVGQLPGDSELAVLDTRQPRSSFDIDREAARQRIDQLRAAPGALDLMDAFDNALDLVKASDRQRKEIYLFTDLARAQLEGSLARWRRRLEANEDVAVYLIDVGVAKPENFALGEIELTNQIVSAGEVARISTEVSCLGEGGTRTAELFWVDGRGGLEKHAEAVVDCRPNEAVRVNLPVAVGEAGLKQGMVRLSAEDKLAADDVRYFTLWVQPPWRLLFVVPSRDDRYTRTVPELIAPREFQQTGRSEFVTKTILAEELADKRLDGFDSVWLLDPPPLPPETWLALSRFVRADRGLAVILGSSGVGTIARPGESFNTTEAQSVLPAKLLRVAKVAQPVFLEPDSLQHPLLSAFRGEEGSVPWRASPVKRYWEIDIPDDGAQVVVPFSNSDPALVERRVGTGRILMMTTPLTESSTDRRPWNLLLAPREEAWAEQVLVIEMARYLVGAAEQRFNYLVGETASLRAAPSADTRFVLTTPGGDQSFVSPENVDGAVEVGAVEQPGHYQLAAGGEQGVRLGFSANLPLGDTQLDRITQQELLAELGPVLPPIARDTDELARSRKITAGRSQWEAFPWLILLLAIVLAGEQLLSAFFYRRPEDSEEETADSQREAQPPSETRQPVATP